MLLAQIDNTIWVAIIAVAGVIVGAIGTFIASIFLARQKIKEIELTYQQKLRENYLTNARQYTGKVYVPLSIALFELLVSCRKFRNSIAIKPAGSISQNETEFRAACQRYDEVYSDLFQRGAGAYLTTELEGRMESLGTFLEASLNAKETDKPVKKMVLRYRLSMPGLASVRTEGVIESGKGRLHEILTNIFGRGGTSFDFFYIGFTAQVPELLSAPIKSKEFEQRMLADISEIRFLIKEVTLGSQSPNT